ncbi:hypothetical protein HGRIS_005894 [Hohenbuehelia grisea]|uniref:Uncharacterized protein n=1 Tax=Hohenbuehelia grisea TaxID=104357 RepID=A0ABR3JYG2_9AGAR
MARPSPLRSTPIQIPARRHINSSSHSPTSHNRPMSPDLIFPMSPEYSSPAGQYSFRYSTAVMMDREPFMYSYPSFPIHDAAAQKEISPLRDALCPSVSPSPEEVEITITSPPRHQQRGRTLSSRHSHGVIRATPAKKITGFKPALPTNLSGSGKAQGAAPSRRSGRLSPPPRRSSFSSSPWILPGKGELLDGDVGSLEAVPYALDFEKYLMGRIESEKRVSFNRLRTVPSMI